MSMQFGGGVLPTPLTPDRPITLDAGEHGTLKGIEVIDSAGKVKARRFCQVPFAHPPTGERRWRKPEALPADAPWSGVEGEVFGGLAPQPYYDVRK